MTKHFFEVSMTKRYEDLTDDELDKATRGVRDSIEAAKNGRKMFKERNNPEGVDTYQRTLEQEERKLKELMKEHSRRAGAP
jgi:hypothetical protein